MKKILILITLIAGGFTAFASEDIEQLQKIVASDREAGDQFGRSVAISGNYAIVGATQEDEDADGNDSLSTAGSAYIYKRDISTGIWTQVNKIVASDRSKNDIFGWSVAISGDYAIVGAYEEDEDADGNDSLRNAGSVYVFKRDTGADTWSEVDKIVASDREGDDRFGWSVSISGDYAIVGAIFEDEDADDNNTLSNAGSAYVFKRDTGADTWSEVDKIVASDRESNDRFGYSVSISGDYAIVGAVLEDEDEDGNNTASVAGSAYVFKKDDGADTWSEVDKIVASDRGENDRFGFSVAISGDYAIVGAYEEDHNADGNDSISNAGSAYVFKKDDGADTWSEIDKIVASDRGASDQFGTSVSISGDYAIVGAYFEDEDADGINTRSSAGSAYVFKKDDGADTWSEIDKIVASDRRASDQFGFSVSISGDYAIVGAIFEDEDADGNNNLSSAGSAYVFATVSNVAPELYSLAAEANSPTSATFYVDVAYGGLATTFTFDYGTATNDYSFSYSNILAWNSATVNVGFEDDSNLAANTQYFVRASTTNSVSWTESEEISFWTLVEEPNQVSVLTQTNIGVNETSVSLSWTDVSANGYLVLRGTDGYDIENSDHPVDGTTYSVEGNIGNLDVIGKTSSNTFNQTGLEKKQSYLYAVIPYNEGDDPLTINYNAVDIKTLRGYTIPTLGEWGMIAFTLLMGIGGVWYARRS